MISRMSTNELRRLRHGGSDFLLLDIAPKTQFDDDHIQDARNVPLDSPDFVAAAGRAAGGKARRIVVYGAGQRGDSANRAAHRLAVAGHTDVRLYAGGLATWRNSAGVEFPADSAPPTADWLEPRSNAAGSP